MNEIDSRYLLLSNITFLHRKTKRKIIFILFSIIGQKKQAGQIDDRLPLISLHQESTTTKVLSSKNSWKAEYH